MASSLYICTAANVHASDDAADDQQMRSVGHNQYLAARRQRDTRRKVVPGQHRQHAKSHPLFKLPWQALSDLPVTVLLDLVNNLKRRAAQVADAETAEYLVRG